MKRILIFYPLFGLLVLLAVSCSKVNPEDQIKDQLLKMSDMIVENSMDSIELIYPQVKMVESLNPIDITDEIVIKQNENKDGRYSVTLPSGISMLIDLDENGKISILKSKGLFAYPSDKMEIAKKTGMYDSNLTDEEMANRMSDQKFFEFIDKKMKKISKNIIKVGKADSGWYIANYPLINQTDQDISGDDYQIIIGEEYYTIDGESKLPDRYEHGKDIPAHGKVWIRCEGSNHGGEFLKGVKFNLSPEELAQRFVSFTGDEYEEYLNSSAKK